MSSRRQYLTNFMKASAANDSALLFWLMRVSTQAQVVDIPRPQVLRPVAQPRMIPVFSPNGMMLGFIGSVGVEGGQGNSDCIFGSCGVDPSQLAFLLLFSTTSIHI